MTVDSIRLLDTRSGSGQPYAGQPIPAGRTLTAQATGTAGIPDNATALVIDLVVTDSTASGTSIYAYPSDAPQPLGASLRFVGPVAFNEFTIKLSANGAFNLYNTYGTTDVVVDILGYYTPESGGTWSYPDLHGNDTVTTDNNATQLGTTTLYDPWGNPLTPPVSASNSSVTSNFSSFGADGKISDQSSSLTIMGARALDTVEGRFTSVDPVFGGCANAYVYVYGDPINAQDLNGKSGCASKTDVAGFFSGLGSVGFGAASLVGDGGELAVGYAFGSLVSGVVASTLDLKNCIAHRDPAACLGSELGFGGAGAGAAGFYRGSVGAGFGAGSVNVGIGGFVSDFVTGARSVVCGIGNVVTSIHDKITNFLGGLF